MRSAGFAIFAARALRISGRRLSGRRHLQPWRRRTARRGASSRRGRSAASGRARRSSRSALPSAISESSCGNDSVSAAASPRRLRAAVVALPRRARRSARRRRTAPARPPPAPAGQRHARRGSRRQACGTVRRLGRLEDQRRLRRLQFIDRGHRRVDRRGVGGPRLASCSIFSNSGSSSLSSAGRRSLRARSAALISGSTPRSARWRLSVMQVLTTAGSRSSSNPLHQRPPHPRVGVGRARGRADGVEQVGDAEGVVDLDPGRSASSRPMRRSSAPISRRAAPASAVAARTIAVWRSWS